MPQRFSEKIKMEEKQYLDKLREYRNYLEEEYKRSQDDSVQESLAGSIAADIRAKTLQDVKSKLEDLFPELNDVFDDDWGVNIPPTPGY